MPNQYTKAKEEGKELPKGSNQFTTGKREKLDQETRDKLRAEKAAAKLERVLDDKNATIEQITAAAKALLPYGKSTYASIEERRMEEPVNEAETLAQLAHLIVANPAILKPIMDADPGVRAALQAVILGSPVPVEAKSAA